MNVKEKKIQCYGCGACENICPFGAIRMCEDESGFLHPEIDAAKCTDCGKCLGVCPRLNGTYKNAPEPECMAAWASDEIRKECASGGIFSAIAGAFLEKGGWVAGAVWEDEFRVRHILTNSSEELKRIAGSKYVQSNIKGVYREIGEKLQAGQRVLFSGCPCQVAGLYAFLGKDYENLYTVDLVCHGVPSSKILTKYLQDCHDYDEIEKVDFRDKSFFGWASEMNIYFKDSREPFRERARQNPFYNAFLWNMCLNKTCESCQFSKLPRQGDVSIGDFWDIEKYDVKLNDGKGTSLVLINNEKGRNLVMSCETIVRKQPVPLDFLKKTCNRVVFAPFRHHYGRDRFLREFMHYDFAKAVRDCASFHYDIGLVTTWFARNYGAIFTAFALYKTLEEAGYSVLMINKPKELWGPDYFSPNRSPIALEFGRRHYNISKEYSLSGEMKLTLLNNSCDRFLLGSDQLWNPKVYAYLFYFFLDFVDWKHKKMSYATSIGADRFEGTESDKAKAQYLLKRFDRISVREDEAVKVCKEEFHVEAAQVLEPVFLLGREAYEKLIKEVEEKEDFIFAYILDGNIAKRDFIQKIAEMYGLPVLCAYDIERPGLSRALMQFKDAEIRSPEEWLWYVKNSSLVITDSFHGACFSIIFNKPFIAIANELRGTGRFKELFTKFKLEKNLFFENDLDHPESAVKCLQETHYENVMPLIERERQRSTNWLLEGLRSEYAPTYETEDYISEYVLSGQREMEGNISALEQNMQAAEEQIKKADQSLAAVKDEIKRVATDLGRTNARLESIHIITDISQLGLKKGCEIQEILNKLPANSYFQQVQGAMGDPIKDTPVPYGVLTIKKTTNYFVDVQFSQMTFASKVPQLWVAHIVDRELADWERLVSEQEYKMYIQKANEQMESCRKKMEDMEKDIRFLIRSYAKNLQD